VCHPDVPDYEAVPMREGLLRSHFALAPPGIGAASYRLLEAMSAGAIPVHAGDFVVLPWAGVFKCLHYFFRYKKSCTHPTHRPISIDTETSGRYMCRPNHAPGHHCLRDVTRLLQA
jgi:hypothetical protein